MSENRQITTPIRSLLLMPGGQLRLRAGRERGGNLHRNQKVASENVLVRVP
jgi:hypothetical protein